MTQHLPVLPSARVGALSVTEATMPVMSLMHKPSALLVALSFIAMLGTPRREGGCRSTPVICSSGE